MIRSINATASCPSDDPETGYEHDSSTLKSLKRVRLEISCSLWPAFVVIKNLK